MKFTASLVALASTILFASAAPVVVDGVEYPEGTQVKVYPDGLPVELIPVARGLESREPHEDNNNLVKRANAGVYLCNDRNFSGYCVHIVAPMYQCIPLGGDLNDQVSSVGPDRGPYCFFFSANGCQDTEGHFGTYSPGYPDLNAINYNDRISSYFCNPN